MSNTKEENKLTIKTVMELTNILKASFGDPDPKSTARQQFQDLSQGKDDFAIHCTKFSRIIRKLRYDDAAKQDGLN